MSGDAEDGVDDLPAPDMARTLAERKAVAVAGRLAPRWRTAPCWSRAPRSTGPPSWSGATRCCPFAGEVRGKPGSPEQAAAWWRSYRDATGTLVTGHAVVEVGSGDRAVGVAATTVRFGAPTDDEIAALSPPASRWRWPAGSRSTATAARSSTGIDGDHGTVLGLSLPLFRTLLGDLGVAVADLW